MSLNKILIALSLGLVIAACAKAPVQTSRTDNSDVPVSVLFTDEDGCKVRRFFDAGNFRYYVTCPNGKTGSTEWSESCGKNCSHTIGVAGETE